MVVLILKQGSSLSLPPCPLQLSPASFVELRITKRYRLACQLCITQAKSSRGWPVTLFSSHFAAQIKTKESEFIEFLTHKSLMTDKNLPMRARIFRVTHRNGLFDFKIQPGFLTSSHSLAPRTVSSPKTPAEMGFRILLLLLLQWCHAKMEMNRQFSHTHTNSHRFCPGCAVWIFMKTLNRDCSPVLAADRAFVCCQNWGGF